MTAPLAAMQSVKTQEFGGRLLAMLTGNVLTQLIAIGHRTGLFDAAASGSATVAELAARAGLDERYVREWAGAMVTGGIMDYEPGAARYRLPPEHAPLLAGAGAGNIGPAADMLGTLASVLPSVARCFTEGGGVPHAEYAAAAGPALGDSWRQIYDEHLISGFLPLVPGLLERLEAGARVLDLGCGTGHAINLMAERFPRSRFVGLDLAPAAIELAEAERAELGLTNASFTVADATELTAEPGYDVVLAFDAIHDQRESATVLRRIRQALAVDGLFVMVDADFSSHLENNLDNPYAALSYGISLLYCVPTARAQGGPALGALWGRELATELLAGAGFPDVTFHASPRPQNYLAVCRPTPLRRDSPAGLCGAAGDRSTLADEAVARAEAPDTSAEDQ
jgi:SAM-dependent methyltransferase